MTIEQIESVHIQLEVEGETVLSIKLSASGTLNRMGDGSGEKEQSGWFLGSTEEPLFAEWGSLLNDELMAMTGRYEYPDPIGEKTELTISLEGNGESTGFGFIYGSDSVGPPEEIMELVNAAVDVTEDWWESQKFKRKR